MLAKKNAAPHATRNFLKALRGLMATAIPAGLRDDDPTLGIRNVKVRATGGFRTWTEEEIAQFEVAHPVGSRARLAFGLLLYTAQRRGDVVRMGRQDIQDGFIRVRRQKTGAITEIPVLPELQEILSAQPVDNKTLLMTSGGQAVHGGGLYGMVPRQVPRNRLAAWLVGAGLAQGRMSSIRRGQLHGPPNRGVFRPRFIEGSPTLHKGRRSKTACRRRDGSPRQKQGENKNWQTQRKG